MDAIRREAASTMHTARRSTSQAFRMEAETPRQLARLALHYPRLLGEPHGDGHPVLFLPGYTASDSSTRSLRRFFRRLGYDARGWGLGRNTGNVAKHAPQVATMVAGLHAAGGRRVSLVGWSMGGVVAREVALLHPDKVRRVITMGSPITGGEIHGLCRPVGQRRGEPRRHRGAYPPPAARQPAPASASDSHLQPPRRVVAWQACIDQINQAVEHVEVESSHLGLGFDPEVYRLIARRLAAP